MPVISSSSDESEDSLHLHFSYDEDSDPGMPSAARRKALIMATDIHGNRQDDGYLMVHFSFLDSLVASMAGPICSSQDLAMERDNKGRLSHRMKVWCSTCEEYVFSDFSPSTCRLEFTSWFKKELG